jgi:cytochrome P450
MVRKQRRLLDIAAPIPATGILLLLGLDPAEWANYSEPYHDALGYPPGSEKFAHALTGLQDIVARIRRLIRKRRESPREDLLGAILSAQVNGERISDDGATSVIYSAFSGGVDTTTSFLGNAFAHLSRNPDARKYLMEDPSRIRLATEELLRCAAPVQGLGRTVLQRTILGGQTLEAGDRVLLVWASANRHEKYLIIRIHAGWIATLINTLPWEWDSSDASDRTSRGPRLRSS